MSSSVSRGFFFFLALAAGCADPCEDVSGPPTVLIGGADDPGETFEAFDDGADRGLVAGPQVGMHVWLHLRTTGLCIPGDAYVDRRVVVDATNEIVDLQRGPVGFVDGPEPGTMEVERAFTMFMCPNSRPIVGERFRFMARIEDSEGNVATAMKPFVAACTSGACDLCTGG